MLSQDFEAFSNLFIHSSFHDFPKYFGFGGLAFHANMVEAQLSIPLPRTQPPFQWMSSVYRLSAHRKCACLSQAWKRKKHDAFLSAYLKVPVEYNEITALSPVGLLKASCKPLKPPQDLPYTPTRPFDHSLDASQSTQELN